MSEPLRPGDSAGDEAGGAAVVCNGAVIRYGDQVAVDGLSFTARRGQVVALLGPNGAGKTSTVEALEGYRRLTSGEMRVLGLDPRRDHAALVPRLGVMLQRGGVYPSLNARQVVGLFARYYERAEDPDRLVDQVGLTDVQRTPWRRLSGGEQQRVALALALVGRPEVLFLDEPTAGVDPEGRLVVRDIVASQRDLGRCVVLTTHELSEAERLADHVVIVDRGRVLAEGSPAALAARTADGSIRFSTGPSIDTGSLAAAIGRGVTVVETSPGSYRLDAPVTGSIGSTGGLPDAGGPGAGGAATPAIVASLTAWLAEHDLSLRDLRTDQSLEEAYLTITRSGREESRSGRKESRTGREDPR